MDENKSLLPNRWTKTTIGELFDIVTGNTPPPKNTEYYGGNIPFVRPSDLDKKTPITVTEKMVTEEGAAKGRLLPKGTVLVSCIGNLGKVGILDRQGISNQQLNSIIPNSHIDQLFVMYWVPTIRSWIEANASATTLPIINKGRFSKAPFLLPPLNEQKRIADKIEALQAKSNKAKQALETAKPLLDKLRQSILAAAFRGDLTADWRKKNPDVEPASILVERIRKERRKRWEETELAKMKAKGKEPENDKWKVKYKEPEPVDTTGLPELPKEWCWASIEEICTIVVDCHNKTAPYKETGIPLVRTTNIRNGRVNMEETKFVDLPTYEFWSKRCKPLPGDILFTREAPMGEAGMIPKGIYLCMGQRMMLLRADNQNLLRKHLLFALQAPYVLEYASRISVGGGVLHMRVRDVNRLPIPIVPIEEQRMITGKVSKLFKIQETVKESLNFLNKQIPNIDQSILAKAFRGELVPQDPTDEPASVLLDRIKAEREAMQPKKKATRKLKTKAV